MTTIKKYNSWSNIITFLSPGLNSNSNSNPANIPFTSLTTKVCQLVYIILTSLLASMSPGQVKLVLLFLIEKVNTYIQLSKDNNKYSQHLDFIASELLVDLTPEQLNKLNTLLADPAQLLQLNIIQLDKNYKLPTNNQSLPLQSAQDIPFTPMLLRKSINRTTSGGDCLQSPCTSNWDLPVQNYILQDLYSKIYPVTKLSNYQLADIIINLGERYC